MAEDLHQRPLLYIRRLPETELPPASPETKLNPYDLRLVSYALYLASGPYFGDGRTDMATKIADTWNDRRRAMQGYERFLFPGSTVSAVNITEEVGFCIRGQATDNLAQKKANRATAKTAIVAGLLFRHLEDKGLRTKDSYAGKLRQISKLTDGLFSDEEIATCVDGIGRTVLLRDDYLSAAVKVAMTTANQYYRLPFNSPQTEEEKQATEKWMGEMTNRNKLLDATIPGLINSGQLVEAERTILGVFEKTRHCDYVLGLEPSVRAEAVANIWEIEDRIRESYEKADGSIPFAIVEWPVPAGRADILKDKAISGMTLAEMLAAMEKSGERKKEIVSEMLNIPADLLILRHDNT
ncbi:MAG: hypothetical protein Q8N98_00910 [bacterium]|nr:hypothetical protein [bacterium]